MIFCTQCVECRLTVVKQFLYCCGSFIVWNICHTLYHQVARIMVNFWSNFIRH